MFELNYLLLDKGITFHGYIFRYPYAAIAEMTYGDRASRLTTLLLDLTIFGGGIPNLLVGKNTTEEFLKKNDFLQELYLKITSLYDYVKPLRFFWQQIQLFDMYYKKCNLNKLIKYIFR